MSQRLPKVAIVLLTLLCSGCVVAPYDGYDEGPQPAYGYYGYGPAYPWALNTNIEIGRGYGHGGYWRGGHGYYGHGGGHGGGWHR